MSGQVGSERAVFPVLVFAFGVAHDFLLSLLGYGQFAVLQGPCLAFRFPARGSHGLVMMVRSQ